MLAKMERLHTGHEGDGAALALHDPLCVWYVLTAHLPGWAASEGSPEDIRVVSLPCLTSHHITFLGKSTICLCGNVECCLALFLLLLLTYSISTGNARPMDERHDAAGPAGPPPAELRRRRPPRPRQLARQPQREPRRAHAAQWLRGRVWGGVAEEGAGDGWRLRWDGKGERERGHTLA